MDEQFVKRIQELTAHFHIRQGQPTSQDANAFVELFNATYSRKVTEAYYFWQFFQSPVQGACLFAEDDKRVVAVYGLRPLCYHALHDCCVGLAVDLIVAPELQRTGLFARLEGEMEALAAALECVCIYAAANEAAYRPRVSTLDWTSMGRMTTFVLSTALVDKRPGRFSFTSASEFGVEIEEIYQSFRRAHPGLAMAQRTSHYLNWRFASNPWYSYDLFIAQRHDEPFGYLVLKTFRDPETNQAFGDIVDLLWADEDADALAEMLHFALGHFHAQGVPQATIWLQTNTLLDQIGRDLGFVETEQKRYFCCKVLDERYAWLKDPKRWFITMADSEIY